VLLLVGGENKTDEGKCPLRLGKQNAEHIAELFRNQKMENGVCTLQMADCE
jgi:hypothetical protein